MCTLTFYPVCLAVVLLNIKDAGPRSQFRLSAEVVGFHREHSLTRCAITRNASGSCAMVVTQFGSAEYKALPAPRTGGLYKIKCRRGRRGHVWFRTASPLAQPAQPAH